MPTKVILRPGVNVTANTLINFEGARVFAERRPGRGPNHGLEIIRVDHARFLYEDDENNPERRRIIGMYVMGTIQDILSGAHIDRANRTTSPERFRPGMQVAYNSNDYEFSIDSTNQFFHDIRGDGASSPEKVVPERVTQGYGIKRKNQKRKPKRKTEKKKSKRNQKTKRR